MANKEIPIPSVSNPTPHRIRLWSAAEVATFLGMSLRWVRQAASDGRLPCVRLPDARAVRFDANVVRAWAVGREQRLAVAKKTVKDASSPDEERRHYQRRRASDSEGTLPQRRVDSDNEPKER
jgi:predicted DNA-binding transcriptional regulator AlpA